MQETGGIPGRPAVAGRDWTKGNVFHNLLRLSWPMVISNILMSIGPTIDMIWVGKLGTASIAAVGIAGVVVQIVMMAIFSLMVGMRAMIARFIGAGDVKGSNHVTQQALVVCAVFAALMAVIGVFLSEAILGLFGLEADVVRLGAAYLRIILVGSVFMCVRMMSDAGMGASGDVVTPMRIAIFYRLLHVALCPFLIFGPDTLLVFGLDVYLPWMFPGMGVSGAAMANVISQSLGTSIGLWFLFSGRTRLKLTLRNFSIDLNIIRRIVRIGLPALVSGVQRSFSYFILMWIIAPFGTAAIAAHTIGQRVEMLFMMPGMAFGMAAGVLAGQNLGAGQPERAERSAWLAVALVEAIMVTVSVAVLIWAPSIVRVFGTDPEYVEIASVFLRIAVAGYIVIGFMAVLMSVLQGAGDTVPGMIINMVIMWAISLPLAYFLPQIPAIGVYGVRWAMVAGMLVGTVAFLLYFRTGRWKRKKV